MNLKYFSTAALGMFSLAMFCSSELFAQVVQPGTQTNGSQSNNINTAVPFLLITPDARTGSMGEAGVATQPDANAMSINPAKLAFLDKPYGFSASYSPWLKNLVPDINLAYISGFYKVNDRSTIGGALRYFSLGQIQLTDANQQDLGIYSPNEFSFDATYSRRFGDEFSLATTGRFIYSNLTSGQFSAGQQTKAGTAFAVDVSAFYKKQTVVFGKDAIISAGANFSNIGTKISYADGGDKYFLPTNMKIGGATTFIIDDYNQFTFALDFNKLMVPTQPIRDSNGTIISGKDPDRSVPAGIFGSFSDAPGGFSEELKEVSIATGVEYWYNQQFALRAGYFYEAPEKGDRRYFTVGAGLKYNIFNIDFSYLLADPQKSPLANTLRFSLLFNFGDTK
ncbi:type IX secretion system outer membrane channel protein PorV [Pedobacter sp. LMG 31464]|uniref:Type IX secretion system outer membrane channel protein PorV n=1 Tax=Pedobacter planticolens TaxID=2679964 RepID=A0A923DXQ6_9SPHI|nr:type IX secretion system outer membrane channel protein PorV [Pedobacter planticolens]MBB2145984.1 type IX secretion system outer membrane channel protein PorV [Pedobacter planticolens]